MNNTNSLNHFIVEFLKQNNKESLYSANLVKEYWKNKMGKFIIDNTSYLEVKNNKMFLTIVNSALKFELINSKNMIIKNINENTCAGAIIDIIFL